MNSSSFDSTADERLVPLVPERRSGRGRTFTATLIAAAVLALGGAGYAAAQMPSGSAAGFGTGSHCH